MHENLLELLQERFGADQTDAEQHHLQFALSNRVRARALINRIAARTAFRFKNARLLDVGCAYAGFPIVSASLGAEAWGVEIDDRFHQYGVANSKDEPGEIHLVQGDFLAESLLAELPGEFDLILVNDVLEHVYDTARLLKHAARLLRQNGLLVFTIPNGAALDFVEREGHNLQLGLTLLEPSRWHLVVKWFSTYYRPWSYFIGLFAAFGFRKIDRWNEEPQTGFELQIEELHARLASLWTAIASSAHTPSVREEMLAALDELRVRAAVDVAHDDPVLLNWKYFVKFWEGCAYRTADPLPGASEYA